MLDREYHISRSWPGTGTPMEDACPCPQEPCGHVSRSKVVPECEQHGLRAAKTLRSSHYADECPTLPDCTCCGDGCDCGCICSCEKHAGGCDCGGRCPSTIALAEKEERPNA